MKTTLELPDELVQEMKLRAVRERRKLKDVAAEIFRRGLGPIEPDQTEPSLVALLGDPNTADLDLPLLSREQQPARPVEFP